MTPEPRGELAVDHVVAVDRLRQQARQRALVPLAVDRVEGEAHAEERRDDADERIDPKDVDVLRREREQREEDGRLAACRLGEPPDRLRREVQRDHRGDPEDDQQDVQPNAEQVVGELLAGDRDPARP